MFGVPEALMTFSLIGLGFLLAMPAAVIAVAIGTRDTQHDVLQEETKMRSSWQGYATAVAGVVSMGLLVIGWHAGDILVYFWSGRTALVLIATGISGFCAASAFILWRTTDPVAKGWRPVTICLLMVLGVVVPLGVAAALVARGAIPPVFLSRVQGFWTLLLADPRQVFDFYRQHWATMIWQMVPGWTAAATCGIVLVTVTMMQCPYKKRRSLHGGSRLATMEDLKRWARPAAHWFAAQRRAVNLLDKGGVILGKFEGRFIRENQTLTTVVLARPGAGKTAGVLMPTVLADGMEDWSLFIFDIKGELYDDTAGHRAKFGPIFRFEPNPKLDAVTDGSGGTRWNPLSPDKSLPGGREYREAMAELNEILGNHYGSDNVLSARITLFAKARDEEHWKRALKYDAGCLGEVLKPMDSSVVKTLIRRAVEISRIQAARESELVNLATSLIPPGASDGGNSEHFKNTGRGALVGMMGFIIARCERSGREPNFGMLIDAWTDATGGAAPSENGNDAANDGIAVMLDTWISECQAYGYPKRYEQELVILRQKPDKERGSIVSTADTALNIFKSATVRERTSTSDFSIEDLRGITGSDGVNRPVTLYIVVTLEDIKAMSPILMMLTSAVQNRLISQPAKKAKKARRVCFMLDEFAQLPKMQCLLSGPAVGRGMRVGNLLIAQSWGQIEENYGQAGVKTVKDTSEWKVIFSLTDSSTAEDISKTIGNTTIEQRSHGETDGVLRALLSKQGDLLHRSVNTSLSGQPLFSASDLMSEDDNAKVRPGQQIILLGGRSARPVLANTPYYFKDKVLSSRAALPPPDIDDARGFCGPLAHLGPTHGVEPNDEDDPPAEAAQARGDALAQRLFAGQVA